jgi:hypothetical protein
MIDPSRRSTRIAASAVRWSLIALAGLVVVLVVSGLGLPRASGVEREGDESGTLPASLIVP